MRAIYILDYSNKLYEPVVDFNDPITGEGRTGVASPQHPESVSAFAQWAAAAVNHFRGDDIVWEIWNEPNVSFWRPEPDVEQYITLAATTVKAIREFVPDAIIIGPATSRIPLPFIEKYLASGAMEYLDGVSVHPCRDYSLSPETVNADYSELRGLMGRYATSRKYIPVISSEWGYASATKGISLEKQAEFLVRMQLANLLYGIPVSIWYDWKNDGDQPGNFEHNCGTVTSRLGPKPAYIAAKTMNMELEGYTLSHRIDLQNDGDFVLVFHDKKGRHKLAAWTMDTAHSVVIPVKIPHAVGAAGVDGYGNELELKTDNGRLVLELKTLPQYVGLVKGIRMN